MIIEDDPLENFANAVFGPQPKTLLELYRYVEKHGEMPDPSRQFCDYLKEITGVAEDSATDLYRPACPFMTVFQVCVTGELEDFHKNLLLILAAERGEL